MTVNPNAPNVLGHEVMVLRQRGLKFTKDQRRAGIITLPATLTDDIAVRLSNVVGNPTVVAEIIPVSSITPANAVLTTDIYRPSADKVMTEARHAGGGTVAPFVVDIDEAVLDTSDWIGNTAASGNSSFGYNVNAALAGGRRPLVVTLHFVMSTVVVLQTGTYAIPFVFTGTKFSLDAIYVTAQQQYDVPLLVNPANGLPWTVADVNAFAAASYFGVDVQNSSSGSFRLFDSWMTVDHVAETRLATGSAAVSVDGWATLSMTSPTNIDTWTPAGGTQYAIILSCAGSGSASWNAVDAGTAHPDISSAPVTITAAGFPSALGTTDTAAPAVVGVDGAGAPLWGQPMSLAVAEAVYAGRVLQQEITLPNTSDRGSVGIVAWQQSALTTVPLTVRLKRRSDNVQIGGDVTINPINVRGKPRIPQAVRLPMAAAASPLTAVQMYVEIACGAASGVGWNVMTVSAEVAAYAALGFGGATDIPTIAGVDMAEREIPTALGLARNPVTGLAAVAV